ncbi:hypothetical protein BP5796_07456 [Coleophoma crateriformis]|uniref:Uncharacterized protein n=1 Tax=Coleophoma crateriformis TaxID=565419 RepID=A0A3D8RJE8_9HELO|nr:hypothetical protein BP5796_07456 [Coleophoma crateriformis]
MARFGGCAWPHLIPAKSSPSLSTQHEGSNSVREAIWRLESKTENPQIRRFSHGDELRKALNRTLPPRPELHSRSSSPAITPRRISLSNESSNHQDVISVQKEQKSVMFVPLPPATADDIPPIVSIDLKSLPTLPSSPSATSEKEPQVLGDAFTDDLHRRISKFSTSSSDVGLSMNWKKKRVVMDSEEQSSLGGTVPNNTPRVTADSPWPLSLNSSSDDEMIRYGSPGLLDPSGEHISLTSTILGFWSRTANEKPAMSRTRCPRKQRGTVDGSDIMASKVKIATPSKYLTSEEASLVAPTSSSRSRHGSDDYFGQIDFPAKSSLASTSVSPCALYTAPQSPQMLTPSIVPRNFTFDGPDSNRPSIRDFAEPRKTSGGLIDFLKTLGPSISQDSPMKSPVTAPDSCLPRDSLDGVTAPKMPQSPPKDTPVPLQQIASIPAAPEIPSASELAKAPNMPMASKAVDVAPDPTVLHGPLAVPPAGSLGVPENSIAASRLPSPKVPEAPGAPEAPGIPLVTVPDLPPPSPGKQKQNMCKRLANKGKRVTRKGRGLLLRKHVLVFILGRQLAGPTAIALKQISKGLALASASDTIGAPVPVPI